ncbi:MAG: division/cell wall cluster transcriptional repressor MraZ [Firmicutes bacterium]|nr:division/cell wall cluster transcriptional repressor MraZ [Bacillota bacterium]
MLRGSHPATVDGKGRLKIPAAFLTELRSLGDEFYVTSDTGDHVWIYPMKAWSEIEERLARIPSNNPARQKFLTRTNYYGQVVTIDRQGRILIPALLREAAQMKGEVVVLGYQNHLRVWNHGRLQDQMQSAPITGEDRKILEELGI